MKYAPNIETLIMSILDAPEKDWSSYFPLVRASKIDFFNAELLIKTYLKGPKRKRAMEFLEVAKSDPKTDYERFKIDCYNLLVERKTFATRQKIIEDLNVFFPLPNGITDHPSLSSILYREISTLLRKVEAFKKHRDEFQTHLDVLRGLNIPEEIKKSDPDQLGRIKRFGITKSYERLLNESLEEEEGLLVKEEV